MKVMKVPYVDLAAQHKPLKTALLKAAARVIDHGQFILGHEVAEFEARVAKLCGVKRAVAVASGTDALILALRALDIGPGDEVITAPNSFVASASAIVLAGATPVFADVGADYNLDPAKVLAAVTPRTKAVLPVHLTGRAADMTGIMTAAKVHGLLVVEDCAQAVLAEHRGRRVGSFGAAGCFSLHPLKTLNACGDGGVVTTNDDAVADRLLVLRNIGLKTRDDCVEWSGNSRLDTLQAALLLVKLRRLEAWTEKRRRNAAFYRKALAGVRGIETPGEHAHERAVYHTYVVQADRRDDLRRYLAERGVGTAVHYPVPIHLHTAAKGLGLRAGSFPVAERQAARIVSLPVHPELSAAQLRHVVDCIKDFYRS